MDYAEEQQSEIEALESIYPSEFTLTSSDPYVITLAIKSENFDDGKGLNCSLKFTLPPNYPDEVPEIEIPENDEEEDEEVTNLEPEEINTLKDRLVSEAQDCTGMAMVFTLVSSALEWLNTRWEEKVKEEEEAQEKRLRAEEEAEHQRFEGTRVTVQSFIAWKTAFDAEMALKRKDIDIKEKEAIGKKLTGRELFMQDKTLAESDLQFETGEGDALPIDESLFEDLDDLDIGDDDELDDDDDEEDED